MDATVSRIKSLDILRGAAIIGVIAVHIMFGAGRGVDGVYGGFNFAELIYAALPMFMVITGYLYKSGKDFRTNVKHRVVPLIVTLVVATVVLTCAMYVYLWLLGYDLTQYDLLGNIIEIIVGKACFQEIGAAGYSAGLVLAPYDISAGFYYLQILAVGLIIFYAIADSVLDNWKHCVIAILSLLSMTGLYLTTINAQLPFSAQLGPVVAAFLLTGALLRKYNVAEYIENGYREKKYWVIFACLVALSAVCILHIPSGMNIYNSLFGAYGGWSVFPYLVLSMSCGLVLMYLAALIMRVPVVSDIFRFAGVNSIVLFTLHMFVAKLIVAPFTTIGTEYWITVESLSMRFVILIVTLAIVFAFIAFMNRTSEEIEDSDVEDYIPTYSRLQ